MIMSGIASIAIPVLMCLINKLNNQEAEALTIAEREITSIRLAVLLLVTIVVFTKCLIELPHQKKHRKKRSVFLLEDNRKTT